VIDIEIFFNGSFDKYSTSYQSGIVTLVVSRTIFEIMMHKNYKTACVPHPILV